MPAMRIFKAFLLFCVASFVFAPSVNAVGLKQGAPDFTLNGVETDKVSLDSYKGKVVLLDFWASWCPPCKKEFPELIRFANKYAGKDVVVIAVSVDKKKEHADAFLAGLGRLPANVVIAYDPAAWVISKYGALAMPTSYIIGKGGTIEAIHIGFREDDPAKWAIEAENALRQGL